MFSSREKALKFIEIGAQIVFMSNFTTSKGIQECVTKHLEVAKFFPSCDKNPKAFTSDFTIFIIFISLSSRSQITVDAHKK